MFKKSIRFLSDLLSPILLRPVHTSNWGSRVLLIKDDALGDFLLFSGVLSFLLSYWNKKQVYLAVNKRIAPVAAFYLKEEYIIAIDFKRYESSTTYRLEILNRLRSIGFETVAASIHRSSVCNHLVKHLGAGIRYGYEKEIIFRNRRFGLYNRQILSFDHLQQIPGQYNHVLDHERYFASEMIQHPLTPADVQPILLLPPQSARLTESPYFVVLPEAGDMKRVFPHTKTLEIIEQLCRTYQMKAIVIGTGQGYDPFVFETAHTINLLGKTTLPEALYIIQKAVFTIGNETGLAHASWIMNIPTVMIYGGGHYGRFLPVKPSGTLLIHRMDCFCCHWNCIYKEAIVPCISRIQEQDILEAVKGIMKQGK